MSPKLIGHLLLNQLKPLALRILFISTVFFQFLRNRNEISTKQRQEAFMKCNFCESQLIKIMRHCGFMNTLFCSVLKDNVVWKYTMIILFWELQVCLFFQNSAYSGKQEMQIHQIVRNICFLSWTTYIVITEVTDLYRWKTAFPTN